MSLLVLNLIMAVAVLLPIAPQDGMVRAASDAEGGNRFAMPGTQASVADCGQVDVAGNRICPAPDDAGYPFIESITSYSASNGISVTFTEAGMEHAHTCRGAEKLATMIARLYGQLPDTERAEEGIEWAIPQMTGEIAGHARVYAAASSELVRNAANPVNIVFPEYRGTFQQGADGINAWAQQIYYGTLCR